jgi:hypothetical protein
MKQLTKRLARRHGARMMTTTHVAHPRSYGVPPADAADVLEMTLGAPLSAVLTGGDVDADWMRAWDCGDEAVGGSVATPDQDIVDDIGRALGVAQEPDAEVWTSQDILRERDRHRWQQEE